MKQPVKNTFWSRVFVTEKDEGSLSIKYSPKTNLDHEEQKQATTLH